MKRLFCCKSQDKLSAKPLQGSTLPFNWLPTSRDFTHWDIMTCFRRCLEIRAPRWTAADCLSILMSDCCSSSTHGTLLDIIPAQNDPSPHWFIESERESTLQDSFDRCYFVAKVDFFLLVPPHDSYVYRCRGRCVDTRAPPICLLNHYLCQHPRSVNHFSEF